MVHAWVCSAWYFPFATNLYDHGDKIKYKALRKKRFLATGRIFVGADGDGAAPTVACSGAQTPAAPTNETAGAAGDTSRPYKWGLICRGGSITGRPWNFYL